MTADAVTQGLWLFTGLAVVAPVVAARVGLVRRPVPAIAAALGVVWVPWLLARDPATGRSVVIVVCAVVIGRYGWRHLLTWAALGLLFALQVYQHVTTDGWQLGRAVLEAFNNGVFVFAAVWLAWTLWQVIASRGRSVTDRLAWASERRKLQATAEHRRAMGWGRAGVGRLGRRTAATVTGRALPAPPRPPDDLDQMNQRDLLIVAKRHKIPVGQHTTAELRDKVREARAAPPEPATARPHPPGPPPPTAKARPRGRPAPTVEHPPEELYESYDLGMPAPLFHYREPIMRIRP